MSSAASWLSVPHIGSQRPTNETCHRAGLAGWKGAAVKLGWSGAAMTATATVLVAALTATAHAETAAPTLAPNLPSATDIRVLPPLDPVATNAPTAAGLQAALAPALGLRTLGSTQRLVVFDALSGDQLYGQDESTPATPASTNKLLTAGAVLAGYGADQQISTKVVQAATPNELVLVGAGDPLLKVSGTTDGERRVASLSTLARRTASAVKSANPPISGPVTLSYDDTLFTGPTMSPTWPKTYSTAGVVAPVTALMADGGRIGGVVNQNPSQATAARFASLLTSRGVQVSGSPAAATAPPDANQVAEVSSAPMSQLVTHTLTESDNEAAEVLGHLAGVRLGGSGSFEGGAQAVNKMLTDLGIDTAGVTIHDGSGLSREDAVPARTLGQLLSAAARNASPRLWPLAYGMPIAGFTGTLATRYGTPATKPGRGVVRAKTGTLTGVSALAGLVTDADGSLLAFALMSPDVASANSAAAVWDGASATLAKCGCK